jgi:hypothetical protein
MMRMDAAEELLRLINGYRTSQAIHVAATLGVSDHLVDGPRAVAYLALATNCHERSLYRLLRALSAIGVYEELPDGQFRSTPLGDQLRSDADGGLRRWAAFVGQPHVWQAWGALSHSVRTGENAFTHVHGHDLWEHWLRHPADGAIFDAAMTALSRRSAGAVLDAYDFGRFAVVADIGGGRGAMLAAMLSRHPKMRGVLFDQARVAGGAPEVLASAGVADRCDIIVGDFFCDVPAHADAYLLRAILHDWPDEQAIAILTVCRRAMKADASLLVLERVLTGPPHSPDLAPAALSDLNMLVSPGGLERTRDEYEAVLAAAGLRLTQVTPSASDVSVIEATPA